MRTTLKPEWILDNDTFVGVNLSYDHCAEHEWGIKQLQEYFPEGRELTGAANRQLIEFDKQLWEYVYNKKGGLVVFDPLLQSYKTSAIRDLVKKLDLNTNNDLATAWDSKSFAVYSHNISRIKELFQAAEQQDLSLWLNTDGWGNNLILCITSRVPPEQNEVMIEADKTRYEFESLVAKTEAELQITERIKARGLRYFALVPKVIRKQSTKYPYVYWLNPWSYNEFTQKDLRMGYISIEDLLEFINGNDEIIKKGYDEPTS